MSQRGGETATWRRGTAGSGLGRILAENRDRKSPQETERERQ